MQVPLKTLDYYRAEKIEIYSINSKSIYTHAKFKLRRNKLNYISKISKRNYNKYFFENTYNSKQIWKGVYKQIVNFEC